MHILEGITGLLLIAVVLWDAFETIILPRRVTRSVRLARLFYQSTWKPWSASARKIRSANRRENFLSYFGPLSILILLGVWAAVLVFGFAVLQWAAGPDLSVTYGEVHFSTALYLSGTTFFTVGLGDVVPHSPLARMITMIEGGVGFGFLGLIISYLPAITGAFSRREVNVSLLDERAGSPPTAYELLRRSAEDGSIEEVDQFLRDWEHWSAELMESHLSYPVLAYFRSQHDNQSWVSALAMILDLSALGMMGIDGVRYQTAQRTFAMARHACVDLTQVFNTPPRSPSLDRLPPEAFSRLCQDLTSAGVTLNQSPEAERHFTMLRQMYEPYIDALADHLVVALPPWAPEHDQRDNWQTTAWER